MTYIRNPLQIYLDHKAMKSGKITNDRGKKVLWANYVLQGDWDNEITNSFRAAVIPARQDYLDGVTTLDEANAIIYQLAAECRIAYPENFKTFEPFGWYGRRLLGRAAKVGKVTVEGIPYEQIIAQEQEIVAMREAKVLKEQQEAEARKRPLVAGMYIINKSELLRAYNVKYDYQLKEKVIIRKVAAKKYLVEAVLIPVLIDPIFTEIPSQSENLNPLGNHP